MKKFCQVLSLVYFDFFLIIVIQLYVNIGSLGFREEVNIFKYVRKEWLELRDRLLFFFDDSGVYFILFFDCYCFDLLELKQLRVINVCILVFFLMIDEFVLIINRFKDSLIMGKKSIKFWGELFEFIVWDVRYC